MQAKSKAGVLLAAAVVACGGAYLAGQASLWMAFLLSQVNPVLGWLREPINLLIAALVFVLFSVGGGVGKRREPEGLFADKVAPSDRFAATSPADAGEDEYLTHLATASPAWGRWPLGLGVGWLWGLAMPALALILLTATGLARVTWPAFHLAGVVASAMVWVVHGAAEEILIRGVLQRAGRALWGELGGILCAGAGFCLLQALQGYTDPWTMMNSLLFGLCLGFLALGAGGIWAAIGAHAGWTWLETSFLDGPNHIIKSTHWLAGTGPDSYGSPMFTWVLIWVLCAQTTLHLRAQRRKQRS